jgi:hypothetical protein
MKKKERIGASEGIRTLDILVGNEMLYQTELRSRSEEQARNLSTLSAFCKRHFENYFRRRIPTTSAAPPKIPSATVEGSGTATLTPSTYDTPACDPSPGPIITVSQVAAVAVIVRPKTPST